MRDETQKAHEPEKQLLTVNETATLLGCSRANVYGLIDAGELPVVSVGKSRGYRIDRSDIDAFIQRRKTYKGEPKPAPPVSRPRLKHIRF